MQSNVTQQRVPIHGDAGHWVHVSESPRHVRVFFGGVAIADSKHAKLVREAEVLPAYYFPTARCALGSFRRRLRSRRSVRSKARLLIGPSQLAANPRRTPRGVIGRHCRPRLAIADHFAFEWPKMDKWMEEDEELFKHARDPYKRVDALPSTRHVRVVIDGQTVAETRRPHLVFETNHPVRYYIPQQDVRMDLLVPSSTQSRCPYKGPASYWSVKLGNETFADLVWGYMETIPECPKIKGLLCFFHERGCEIYVDGEKVPAPNTKWASPLRS